jgi:hypothetical protein|tara:strand:- start:1647 stop:2150 length:504 start_codon:yes stop_codon:yes gene_type:complete
MTKTSKVVNIKSAGAPYESQYGTLYGFYISFENGDNGKYNSKTEDCVKFVIGSEATYEYIPREYQGKTYYTVKAVNPQFATGATTSTPTSTGGSMTTNESIIRQTALKASAELGGTPAQVIANAQMFADWVMKTDSAQSQVTHQQHLAGREQPQQVAPPIGNDGLPF